MHLQWFISNNGSSAAERAGSEFDNPCINMLLSLAEVGPVQAKNKNSDL